MGITSTIKYELLLILVAVQFLTRIPVKFAHYDPEWLHQSSRHFPAVGLLVGLACAVVLWLAGSLFSPLVAVVISTVFGIRLTGAFHEDGLADTCDGLGGGLTRERTLSIMKDSRLGTYGTLGLVSALLLKISLLTSLSTNSLPVGMVALVMAHTASRLLCTSLIVLLPYGGEVAHAKAKPMAQQMSIGQWCLSSVWLLMALAILFVIFPYTVVDISLANWLFAVILAVIALIYMYRLLKRRLQGYTGDGLGATQQITEIAIYAGLAAVLPFI